MDFTIVKYILIGDTQVGKTSIIEKYTSHKDVKHYIPTIGVEFDCKFITYNYTKYKLNIWDTAGQEMYRTITRSCYKNANCIMIVYDITNRESFENIPYWISYITNEIVKPTIILVGNKSDDNINRQVSTQEAFVIAEKYNIEFIEVSAKNSKNISKLFLIPVHNINSIDDNYDDDNGILLNYDDNQNINSSDCCCYII